MGRKPHQGVLLIVLGAMTVLRLSVVLGGRSPLSAAISAQSMLSTSQPIASLQLSRPDMVPAGTVVRLHGGESMTVVNDRLKQSFEAEYANTSVDVATNSTQQALTALVQGNIDLAAIGRQLTPEESKQGIVQVTLRREKIAVIVGPDNSFDGDLTTTQFARIFRGEITNWADVGGKPGTIRFIDRPDDSDVRLALREYGAFKSAPFASGPSTLKVAVDDTNTVIKALGRDGISYAPTSHVLNLDTVRLVSMHKVLPTNPDYPYSQPRAYAYFKQPSAAAIAFLGYGASPQGRVAIQSALDAEAEAIAAGLPLSSAIDSSTAIDNPSTDSPTGNGVGNTSNTDEPDRVTDNEFPESLPSESPTPAQNSHQDRSESSDNAPNNGVALVPEGEARGDVPTPLPVWFWWLLPIAVLALLLWQRFGNKVTSTPHIKRNEAKGDRVLGDASGEPNSELVDMGKSMDEADAIVPSMLDPNPNLDFDSDVLLDPDPVSPSDHDLDWDSADSLNQANVLMGGEDNSQADDFLNALPEPDEGLSSPDFGPVLSALPDLPPNGDDGVDENPENGTVWIDQGHVLANIGQYEDAMDSFERALVLRPNSAAALAGKGRVALLTAQPEAAIAHFKAVALEHPNEASLALYQGHSFAALHRWDEALAEYNRCLRIDAHCLDATLGKGTIFVVKGQTEDAIVCFNQILDILLRSDPGNLSEAIASPIETTTTTATILPTARTRPETTILGLPLLSSTALTAQALNGRGEALLKHGYIGAALDNLQQAADTDPHNPDLWVSLGKGLNALQRTAEAIACFDRALALNPDHAGALQGKLAQL